MKGKCDQEFLVRSEVDVLVVRRRGMRLLTELGFSEIDAAAIEIIISELGTNIVKHAGAKGWIRIRVIDATDRKGVEIQARNDTPIPGVSHPDEAVRIALTDGVSSTGTLGIGLSGVRRLADEFDIRATPSGCLEITAYKWLMKTVAGRVKVSVLSKPKLGERLNGDGYFIKHLRESFFFSVIDGLGHGPRAHEATKKLLAVLEISFNKPLTEVIAQCHTAVQRERGAAMTVGRVGFDPLMLHHISVGNVSTRIFQGGVQLRPFCQNGTVGVALGNPEVHRYPLKPGACMITTTDGISDRYHLTIEQTRRSVQEIAHLIFNENARSHDDATILVVKTAT